MKRVFLFAALGLMGLAASCNSLDTPVTEAGEGTLILSFTTGSSPMTKSDTNPSGKDATIHDIQAFQPEFIPVHQFFDQHADPEFIVDDQYLPLTFLHLIPHSTCYAV